MRNLITIIYITTVLLTNCYAEKDKVISIRDKAIIDARNNSLESYKAYLNCYAFHPEEKKSA